MENWNEWQNKAFSGVFDALKKQKKLAVTSDALAMLRLNDENFIKLYLDTVEITGDQEDIDLCIKRAKELGI